jgi:hypothetical protein
LVPNGAAVHGLVSVKLELVAPATDVVAVAMGTATPSEMIAPTRNLVRRFIRSSPSLLNPIGVFLSL